MMPTPPSIERRYAISLLDAERRCWRVTLMPCHLIHDDASLPREPPLRA